jgi:carbamate kinase
MMRVVIALGGNALLHRGEPLTAENQRRNVKIAAAALAPIAHEHQLVITHGNGPQVGLLALQCAAYKLEESFPLDVLDAETEGMIGYLIEQELSTRLPARHRCATLLTLVEVDPKDPAFDKPSKPIGPVYSEDEARTLQRTQGWHIARDGIHYRRVVPSPRPKRIFELAVIELLVSQNVTVICAGGGGIPTVAMQDGSLIGIEAVIDKDLASGLLARQLNADAFIMLTDVDAVYDRWGVRDARAIRRASPQAMCRFDFAAGSMGPKIDAAVEFAEQTGGLAGIGLLVDAQAILQREAGTVVARDAEGVAFWER